MINIKTRIVNRDLNFSSSMQIVENLNTLAEINKTTDENIIPIGSNTKVKLIGADINIKHHSKMQVD